MTFPSSQYLGLLKSSHFLSIPSHLTLLLASFRENTLLGKQKKKKTKAAFHFNGDIFISPFPGKNREPLRALAGGRTIKSLKLPCFCEECHSICLVQRFYSS